MGVIKSKVRYKDLYLVTGRVPHYREMVKLGGILLKIMIEDLGVREAVKRFGDPNWFQALATFLGMEWYTSGSTTVTFKALKEAAEKEELEISFLGGKGREALNTIEEIRKKELNEKLETVSRLTAKADNALLQDSYELYFHGIVYGEGEFVVINQGMNPNVKVARRYHWDSKLVKEFSNLREPTRFLGLNLLEDKGTQKLILDSVSDQLKKLYKEMLQLNYKIKKLYSDLPNYLKPPRKIDYSTLEKATTVKDFKEFLLIKGVGPSLLRALAFATALIYGNQLLWERPGEFALAHGTKSGKPYYVNRKLMLEHYQFLKELLERFPAEHRRKLARRLVKTINFT